MGICLHNLNWAWTYHWRRFLLGKGAMMRGYRLANHTCGVHVPTNLWALSAREKYILGSLLWLSSCPLNFSAAWLEDCRKLTAPKPKCCHFKVSLICVPHRCAKTIASHRQLRLSSVLGLRSWVWGLGSSYPSQLFSVRRSQILWHVTVL